MHARAKRPPTPSSLTADKPLAVHFHAHLAALALLVLAVLLDSPAAAALAGAAGVVGAAAYVVFFWALLHRTGLIRVNAARGCRWLFWYRNTEKDRA